MISPFCPLLFSPALYPLTPAGVTGEVGLPAKNGEPGKDVEEALVCPETGTDYVLQVPGETPLPQDSSQKGPGPNSELCSGGQKKGWWGPRPEDRGLAGGERWPVWAPRALSLTWDPEAGHGFLE